MEEFISGDKIYKYTINTSKAKSMYSFPKSIRFLRELPSKAATRNHAIYTLPTTKVNRSAGIGYGKKYSIISINYNKEKLKIQTVPYYDTDRDRVSTEPSPPKYSFGLSRDLFGKVVIENEVSNPTIASPGPAAYNTRTKIGKWAPSYTFRPRTVYSGLTISNENPGPGTYKSVNINKDGLYPLSKYRNTERALWSLSKFNRFLIVNRNKSPCPGDYDIKGLINGSGQIFNSKFHSGTAKSFGLKFKSIFDVPDKDRTPGPGSYSCFSEFGFYRTTFNSPVQKNKSHNFKKYNIVNGTNRSKLSTRSSYRTTIETKTKQ